MDSLGYYLDRSYMSFERYEKFHYIKIIVQSENSSIKLDGRNFAVSDSPIYGDIKLHEKVFICIHLVGKFMQPLRLIEFLVRRLSFFTGCSGHITGHLPF